MVGGGNRVKLVALHEEAQQEAFQLPKGQTVSSLDCASASGLIAVATQVHTSHAWPVMLMTPEICVHPWRPCMMRGSVSSARSFDAWIAHSLVASSLLLSRRDFGYGLAEAVHNEPVQC